MTKHIPLQSTQRLWPWLALAAALGVTFGIYQVGLHGGFVYDDFGFIVGNASIKVSANTLQQWFAAAVSFPTGTYQGRWLGMLSFAANHYLTGMDPYWFKLTNLGIHLLNGVLLFLALRALFSFHHASRNGATARTGFDPGLAAAALASLWLVLPINLTAVLYISQRLESLSNTFVFLGLWWYLRARLALWQGRSGVIGLWLALLVGTGIGVLVKESAVLLPLYAFSVELALTGFRQRDGRWSAPVLILYGSLLLIPLVVGLVWLAGWVGGPRSYGRAFDIPERLMTEGRILIQYMVWTLAPSLDSLTLFHDDITISKSLLNPPTTLASILAISGLIGLALWKHKRFPLFALGIFWYFGGHLLTATVIPLMLAFEHRNYYPSVGLLLALASLFTLEGPVQRRRLVMVASLCLFSFYAFTTALRSMEWSTPLSLSASDAAKRPNSSAAQYEYARILLGSKLNGDPEPLRRKAFEILERMSADFRADAVHSQLLIVASADHNLPIRKEWWDSMIAKLAARPLSSVDVEALRGLLDCFESKRCPRDVANLKRAFEAATDHPGGYGKLFLLHGLFAQNFLEDPALAERQTRRAIQQSPSDPFMRANLAALLTKTGKLEEAGRELEILRTMNRLGVLDSRIAELERGIQDSERQIMKTSKMPAPIPD